MGLALPTATWRALMKIYVTSLRSAAYRLGVIRRFRDLAQARDRLGLPSKDMWMQVYDTATYFFEDRQYWRDRYRYAGVE